MAENEPKALVVQRSSSLAEVGAGARSILSSVVSDALTVARSREKAIAAARFQIGRYDFREPDYCQILIWAKALEIDPEALVQQLEATIYTPGHLWDGVVRTIFFRVHQGSIVSLAWDVSALPLRRFDWVLGLSIQEIAVFGEDGQEAQRPDISFSLPCLSKLAIRSINLKTLDLSNVPGLTVLYCWLDQLTELELSNVPSLTELNCGDNPLTALDLSNVPKLQRLSCWSNQLSELDLSNVPGLTGLLVFRKSAHRARPVERAPSLELDCSDNQLSELDLSNVSGLTELQCSKKTYQARPLECAKPHSLFVFVQSAF